MEDSEKVLACIFIPAIIIGFVTLLPFIFGTTVEKDITVVYSDANGIIDSCNNFYFADDMNSKTITEIGKLSKDGVQPIKVKMFIPNRGLTPLPDMLYNNVIKEVIGGSGIKSNNCI